MANITVFLQFSLVVRGRKLLIENNFLNVFKVSLLIETFNVEMTETIIFFLKALVGV